MASSALKPGSAIPNMPSSANEWPAMIGSSSRSFANQSSLPVASSAVASQLESNSETSCSVGTIGGEISYIDSSTDGTSAGVEPASSKSPNCNALSASASSDVSAAGAARVSSRAAIRSRNVSLSGARSSSAR